MQMSPATLRAAAKGDPAIERFLKSDEYKDQTKLMEMIGASGILQNADSRAKLSGIVGDLDEGKKKRQAQGGVGGKKGQRQGDL
mmetsp:Transcript_64980/g.186753  ORF Transcript_64980/g.186753 Transcript_64980/m.186753 type:complete len:84 (+) Transcript_64980:1-252(+)